MKFEKLYGRSPFFLSYCSFTAHHAKGNRHAIRKWPRSNMEGRLGLLAAVRTADVLRRAIQEARNASAEMTQTIGLPKGALHLVVN